jgi:hypothetical protein
MVARPRLPPGSRGTHTLASERCGREDVPGENAVSQQPSRSTNLGLEARRAMAERWIEDYRPWAVPALVTIVVLTGLIAVVATAPALIAVPARSFALSKPLAILLICLAQLVAGGALASGLHRGNLWAWLASVTWSTIGGVLPALVLGRWIQGGLPLGLALRTAPFHVGLVLLSCFALALLFRRDLRSWVATARRLRAGKEVLAL